MANISIRTATAADLDDIARIHTDALEQFTRFSVAMYGQDPREVVPGLTKYAFGNPQNVYALAVEVSSGQTVGFLRYKIVDPSNPPPEVSQSAPPGLKHKEHLESIWRRYNDARETEQDALYEELHKGRRHAYIGLLMVDPKHQRKGIGRKLLQTALDVSDRELIPSILVSSKDSHPLYSKMGFEDVKVWTTDNGYWTQEIEQREKELGITGNEGVAKAYAGFTEEEALMVRWPQQGS